MDKSQRTSSSFFWALKALGVDADIGNYFSIVQSKSLELKDYSQLKKVLGGLVILFDEHIFASMDGFKLKSTYPSCQGNAN